VHSEDEEMGCFPGEEGSHTGLYNGILRSFSHQKEGEGGKEVEDKKGGGMKK